MEAGGVIKEPATGFEKAIEQANEEFRTLYTEKMRYLKKTDDRVTAAKMVLMRARDIASEATGKPITKPMNVFAYDYTARFWNACPVCGGAVNQDSDGRKWQGCRVCSLLLNSDGVIIPMGYKGPVPRAFK